MMSHLGEVFSTESGRFPEPDRIVLRQSDKNDQQSVFWGKLEDGGRKTKTLLQPAERRSLSFSNYEATTAVAVARQCDDDLMAATTTTRAAQHGDDVAIARAGDGDH